MGLTGRLLLPAGVPLAPCAQPPPKALATIYAALPVYFKNAAPTLYEHPGGFAILAYQPGKRQLADFRAGLAHLGTVLRRQHWFRVVSDQRVMTPFTDDEQALILPFWQEYARQTGHGVYAAVLLADDVFARLASNQLRQEARLTGVAYRLFNQHEAAAAEAWLGQLTQPPHLAS